MKKTVLLLPLLMLSALAPAMAANIVVNPGFETGNFTGWTGASGWNVTTTDPHSGTQAAGTGCVGATCLDPVAGAWFSQTLTTVALSSYNVSFWIDPVISGCATCEIDVRWNGSLKGSFVNEPGGYHQYTINSLVASGSSTVLQFNGRHDPQVIWVDDIDVEGLSGSSTPEPASFLLASAGLAAVGFFRRKRSRLT